MSRLRNRWLFSAAIPLWLCGGGMAFNFGTVDENDVIAILGAGTFLFAICYGVALATMFSFVGLSPDGLVVRNPGRRFVIPWGRVKEITYDNGLDIKVSGRREASYCVAFQRSFIAQVMGGPSARRAAEKIEAYRQGRTGSGEIVETVPWRAHAWWAGTGWVLISVAVPLFGRLTTFVTQ